VQGAVIATGFLLPLGWLQHHLHKLAPAAWVSVRP
jgi:hypothetical protein